MPVLGTLRGHYTQIIPAGTKLTTWYPDRPGQGDNFLGMLIEPPNAIKNSDRKLMVLTHTDAQEMTGGPILQSIINELLSGSALARRALSTLSVLVIPFQLQQAVTDGLSRYGLDCPMPGNTGFNTLQNGFSEAGEEILNAAVANWLSDHSDPSHGYFGQAEFHCDYIAVPWAQVRFKDLTAQQALDQFMAGFNADPAFCATTRITGLSGTGSDNPGFIIELPWREPSFEGKPNLWWDGDDLEAFGKAFLSGITSAMQIVVPLATDTSAGIQTSTDVHFITIQIEEGPAEDLVGAAQLSLPTGKSQKSGTAVGLTGTVTLGVATGRKEIKVAAASLTGAATLSTLTGKPEHRAAATTLSGSATLAVVTAKGQHFTPASNLTGAVQLSLLTGKGQKTGAAANFVGVAALSVVLAKKSISRSALTLTGDTALSLILALAEHRGPALSLLATPDISLAIGYAPGRVFPLEAQVVLSLGEGFASKYGAATDLDADVILWVARGWGMSRKYHGLKVSDVLKRSKIKVHGG